MADILGANQEVQPEATPAKAEFGNAIDEEIIWTDADQAQLEEELSRVEFNPDHAPSKLPTNLTAEVNGREIPIHEAGNFIWVFGVLDLVRRGYQFPPERPFERGFAAMLDDEERKYAKILQRFQENFPALYKKLQWLYRQGRDKYSSKEHNLIRSQGYSVAAKYAKEIDQNYNLRFLVG